jgi:hypothetical protein
MAVLATLLIAGCGTKHTPGTTAYVPIWATQMRGAVPVVPANAQASTIIVKRDRGLAGSALSAIFTVDGVEVADIPAGYFYRFDVEAGEHIFGVKSKKEGFVGLSSVFRELAVDCKPQRTNYLRLHVEYRDGIQINRSSY